MRAGEVVSDRFEIHALAGEGAMGVVYSGVDRATKQRVAVKLLHDISSQQVARFVREAELLAGLEHRFIVRYVAHGDDGGRPFLVTEWLDGEELAERLLRGRLGVRETLLLARCLAEALGEAHRRGIVHRDVKPSNVFLVGGSLEDPRLLDFGVARAGARSEITASGAMIGTLGYLSPEQARGLPDVDARADVFALGATIFKCLTGRRPFESEDALAMMVELARGTAPSAKALRSDVPEALDALIARMLHTDRGQRPANGEELARTLADVSSACEEAFARLPRERAPARAANADAGAVSSTEAAPRVATTSPELASTLVSPRMHAEPTAAAVVSPTGEPSTLAPSRRRSVALVAAALAGTIAIGMLGRWGSLRSEPQRDADASPGSAAPSAGDVASAASAGASADPASGPVVASAPAASSTAGALPPPPASPPRSAAAARALPSTTATPGLAANAFDEARARSDLRAAVTAVRADCKRSGGARELYLFWVTYDPASGSGAVRFSPSVQTAQSTARTVEGCAQAAVTGRQYRVSPFAGPPREMAEQIEL